MPGSTRGADGSRRRGGGAPESSALYSGRIRVEAARLLYADERLQAWAVDPAPALDPSVAIEDATTAGIGWLYAYGEVGDRVQEALFAHREARAQSSEERLLAALTWGASALELIPERMKLLRPNECR